MGYFREIGFETKWLAQDIALFFKHPSRKQTRADMSYHLSKLYHHAIGHPIYALKRGIKNCWSWFPLIWTNDVWDHFQLEDLIEKQLKDMLKFWESDYPVVMPAHKRRIAKRIRWTLKLMNMYRDEYYTMKWYDAHNEKYPFKGNMFEKAKPAKVDEYGVVLSWQCESKFTDEEAVEFRTESEIARLKDEKVFKLFMKNFSHFREWWD